jgi:hypothetical protein
MTIIQPVLKSETSFGEGPFVVARQSATPGTGGALNRLDAAIFASGSFCWGESRTLLGANIGAAPPGDQFLRVRIAGNTFENVVVNNPGPGYAASYAAIRIGIFVFDPQGNVVDRRFSPDFIAFDDRAYFTGFHLRFGESKVLTPSAVTKVVSSPNSYQIWIMSYQKVESYVHSIDAVSNFSFDFGNIDFTFTPA